MFGQHGTARGQVFALRGGGQQAFRRPHGALDAGIKQARRELRAADDASAIGVIKAYLQAFHGRVFIDGQPSGARLGNRRLHEQ